MFPTDAREQATLSQAQPFKPDGWEHRLDGMDGSYSDEADGGPAKDELLDGAQAQQLHKVLLSYYDQELFAQADQRAEMRKDEAFYDGDQWTEEDRRTLEARGQMPLVYNVIAPSVNWLLGTERRSRTQYKILARTKDGTRAAELKSNLLKYLSDVNRAPHHQSKAFADAVKVGVGWLEAGYQGTDEEEPVYTRAESWRAILWDTRSTEDDLTDARYIFRAKWTDCDIAKQMFPHRAWLIDMSRTSNADLSGIYLDGDGDEAMDERETSAADYTPIVGVSSGLRNRVRIIECWYRVPVEEVFLKGGEFSGEVFDPWSVGHIASISSGMASTIKRVKMRVHLALMTHKGLIYNDVSPYRHNRFPFTPVWGNRRGDDGMPYGIVRNLRDIQQDINKRASKALHILNSSKVIMDEGAVEDLDELAEEAARPDGIIVKKKGAELKIDTARDLAAPHLEMMSRDIDMVQQQSGITDEAMGRTTNAASGKAIIARQNQGSVAVSHFLDNFAFARKVHGEKELSLVEQYFSEEKEFRITNKRGRAEYIKINDGMPENDIARTKADFIISEEDWTATKRQAQFEELAHFSKQYAASLPPQIGLSVFQLLVEASDLPSKDDIVNQLRTITDFNPDADDDEQPTEEELARKAQKEIEREMQSRAAEAEISGKEAQAAERFAKAEKIAAETQRTEAQILNDRLSAIEKSVHAAVAMLGARPAVPVADRLMADASTPAPTETDQRDPQQLPMPAGV